jgi:hypothetical protein
MDSDTTLFSTENSNPTVITITPRTLIRTLLVCMSLLVMAGLAGQISRWQFGHDYVFGFVREFDLNQENNVPTWFSTICLFLCAIALVAIALAERRKKGGAYWFGLAGTFVLLSLDEAASFHESLTDPVGAAVHAGGIFQFAWVIPGGLFALGVLLVCWRFLGLLPAETRRQFLVAGFIFCSGCLGMEMIDGRYFSLHGRDFTYALMGILEEWLEMLGEILFLRSLLAYLANYVGSVTLRLRSS